MFEWVLIIHVVSAAVLFGTGLGTAFYMWYVNRQSDIQLIADATKQVVFADWLFTGSSGIIQILTGIVMIYLKGYSFKLFWIMYGFIGYFIAGICWLPVVYLQIRCRDLAYQATRLNQALPSQYYRCYTLWRLLGIPAFLALVAVFYLMANRPVHW